MQMVYVDIGNIRVDGHTFLDNVSISGVTTTSGLLDINAGGQANTFKVEDLTWSCCPCRNWWRTGG